MGGVWGVLSVRLWLFPCCGLFDSILSLGVPWLLPISLLVRLGWCGLYIYVYRQSFCIIQMSYMRLPFRRSSATGRDPTQQCVSLSECAQGCVVRRSNCLSPRGYIDYIPVAIISLNGTWFHLEKPHKLQLRFYTSVFLKTMGSCAGNRTNFPLARLIYRYSESGW